MSYVKFHHVFGLLLLVSALAAFAIPEKYAVKPLPGLQALFAPVSMPVRRVAGWAHDRLFPHDLAGKRTVAAIVAENERLTNATGYLQKQLDAERRRNAEWAPLAELRDRCIPLAVSGVDAGTRESLALPASTLERVADGAFALYPGGVAGRVQGRVGFGGAQLRLVTDRGFKVRCHISRRAPGGEIRQMTPVVVLEGVGDGAMTIRGAVTWDDVEKQKMVQVGDSALLDDRDWPADLHGQRLGIVTRVEPMREQRKFADIRVEPSSNLLLLNEVMVFTK
jgi:hypothetical protein